MLQINTFIENIKIENISPHVTSFSKDIKQNSVFFALEGIYCHGSDFIVDALTRGASLVFHDDPN